MKRTLRTQRCGWAAAGMTAAAVLLAGCSRDSINSYQVPKEDYAPKFAAAAAPRDSVPHAHWEVPPGWKQEQSDEQMRVGSFRIEGEEGKFAQVRIVPLRGAANDDSRYVEMWKNELGLPEGATNEVKAREVDIAGAKGRLYDLTSPEAKFLGKYKARTTAAILPLDGTLWFIKMSGEESIVAHEQDAFRNFLKSLTFEAGGHDTAPAPMVAAGSGEPSKQDWKVPSTWTEQPAGQMILAAYQITKGHAKANVTVTSFPGNVGGLAGNVNRWRRQVGLPEVDEREAANEVKDTQLSDGTKATIVDLKGKARLYTLVVPRSGSTWFYKLLGDDEAVAAETSNLAEFAVTAH